MACRGNYLGIKGSDRYNEACFSIKWETYWFGNTINYCGYHKIENNVLRFDIRDWANDETAMKMVYASEFLPLGIAILELFYNSVENQKALVKSLGEFED